MLVSSIDRSVSDLRSRNSLPISIALIAVMGLLLGAARASAGMEFYFDPHVGDKLGDVSDTATDEFLTAIDDSPTEYLSFSSDRDGMDWSPLGPEFHGQADGREFSYRLVLASPDHVDSEMVELDVSAGGDAMVGPRTFAG